MGGEKVASLSRRHHVRSEGRERGGGAEGHGDEEDELGGEAVEAHRDEGVGDAAEVEGDLEEARGEVAGREEVEVGAAEGRVGEDDGGKEREDRKSVV